MFGAGGGTSSYEEVRETADLIVLWGSNAREAHPIFFHHVLKAVHRGAKLIVVDPRRTVVGAVGRSLARPRRRQRHPARECDRARDHPRGLVNTEFIERATVGFDEFRDVGRAVDARGGRARRPACRRTRSASWRIAAGAPTARRSAGRSGSPSITTRVDNVFALINLSLLGGDVGRYGAGLQPLRGQNNVQGGGDMGAIPNRLPGLPGLEDDGVRAKFDAAWGATVPREKGLHLTEMFEAMEHGDLRALYVIGENPAQSEADQSARCALLRGSTTSSCRTSS